MDLERHPDLKIKVAHNVPRKRAHVNRVQIEEFFTNISKEIEAIPHENILNMDESGFNSFMEKAINSPRLSTPRNNQELYKILLYSRILC